MSLQSEAPSVPMPMPDLNSDAASPPASPPESGSIHLFRKGFLYSSPGLKTHVNRISATVLMAPSAQDFVVNVKGHPPQRAALALFHPAVDRELDARGAPFVCLDLYPHHPKFRFFRSIGKQPGMRVLPRTALAAIEVLMHAFVQEPHNANTAHRFFRLAVDHVAQHLPDPGPIDPRVERTMTLLMANPDNSVEQLACAVCLSVNRLSHLFSHELGLSLRRYMQGQKVIAAARYYGSGLNLKEIAMAAGFADAPHFSKVWVQTFGIPPAYYFNSGKVDVTPKPSGTSPV